ncbi:MAG: right-handed parallel beta-helix repeat-containing protein [Verrucomicrobiales bacterium]
MTGRCCLSTLKLLAFSFLLAPGQVSAVDFYLARDGNDQWSGKLPRPNAGGSDGPVATLAGARGAVRNHRAGAGRAEPIRVLVADGIYRLTEPFLLSPEDGGTKDAPLSYQAAPGAKPVFSGGRVITGWKSGPNGLWQTKIPEVANGTWYFEQLWVNGRRATRARTPNEGWYGIEAAHEEVLKAGKGELKPGKTRAIEAIQSVTLPKEGFAPLSALRPDEVRDVHFVVYHKWDNTRRFIDSLDVPQSTLTTSGAGMKSWNKWDKNSTWIAENAMAFLDAPGEWFLARDGTLSYLPLAGEDPGKLEVIAPVTNGFLRIAGDPAKEKSVEHLSIKGLAFRHAQWLTPPGGFEPNQAAATLESAVLVDGARHVTIENCEFGHLGTYALWFRRGCRDSVIRQCHIHDFGAGGVRIGETAPPPDDKATTSHITVDNCIIRHGGSIFPCAVGVWIGFSPDNRITHNEIADLFYTGISVGWRWGYAESNCKRNTIAHNHVHHIGKGLLSDMGGIYTLGPSEGTVVTGNVFHDILSYSYGGWGLYTDEGSTGILFENNLVYRTKTGGFHQHYGKENIVRNNIFVDSQQHQIQVTRPEPHLSFTFEKNLIYWTHDGPALGGPWDKVRVETNSNLYWSTAGSPKFPGGDLKKWQAAGHEKNSILADPLFTDATKGDYRLQPESPAYKLGFKPFDFSKAGVYGAREWLALAGAFPK